MKFKVGAVLHFSAPLAEYGVYRETISYLL